jgi:hypothetical protein
MAKVITVLVIAGLLLCSAWRFGLITFPVSSPVKQTNNFSIQSEASKFTDKTGYYQRIGNLSITFPGDMATNTVGDFTAAIYDSGFGQGALQMIAVVAYTEKGVRLLLYAGNFAQANRITMLSLIFNLKAKLEKIANRYVSVVICSLECKDSISTEDSKVPPN